MEVKEVKNAFIIADMTFMSYQSDIIDAGKNAGRLIKESGANAVKLEGGVGLRYVIRSEPSQHQLFLLLLISA